MCLAVPGRVLSIQGDLARVSFSGNVVEAWANLVPDLMVGDYALVHAGCVIAKMDEKAAAEVLALLEGRDSSRQLALG